MLTFIYKKTIHTPGSGQQTEPRTRAEPNRAKYRGTQPKRLAATAAWAAGAGSGGHTPGRARGGGMGGGKGAAGCDQDMRTYSARPRRIAKPQAIRANGATRGAAHVTAGMRAKGTCASVRRDRRERRRWPEGLMEPKTLMGKKAMRRWAGRGGRARGPMRRYSSRRDARSTAAWAPSLVVSVW